MHTQIEPIAFKIVICLKHALQIFSPLLLAKVPGNDYFSNFFFFSSFFFACHTFLTLFVNDFKIKFYMYIYMYVCLYTYI